MIEINGEYTTAEVKGEKDMFDDSFFNQVQEMVDHEAFDNEVVIQPDGHAGAGAVIGFTMPIGNKLIPNIVGNDIGCGVTAVNIGDTLGEFKVEEVDSRVRDAVPMDLGETHDYNSSNYHMIEDFPWDECQEIREEYDSSANVEYGKEYLQELSARVGLDIGEMIQSMGTLGSGNHFFEVSESVQQGDFWLVVHSGSRCVGGSIASYWQEKASKVVEMEEISESIEGWMYDYLNFDPETDPEEKRQWVFGGKGEAFYNMDKIRSDFNGEEIEDKRREIISVIPEQSRNEDLDYLEGSFIDEYITDMVFAQQYARENRKQMLRSACENLSFTMGEMIDSIHNYIDFRDGVIRKGATRASEGERLIIPFNMAEGAVICRGKGNSDFNNSAPHGAGRRGSRTWAENLFSVEDFERELGDVYSSNNKENVLDEIPSAYKSSDNILKHLVETAEPTDTLTPVLNMKGESTW